MARRRVGHYLAGTRRSLLPEPELPAAQLSADPQRVAARQPGQPKRASTSLILLRDGSPRNLARRRFSVALLDGDPVTSSTGDLGPARSAPPGQARASSLTYDPGRELRDQVIDRSTRLLVRQTGIEASSQCNGPGTLAASSVCCRCARSRQRYALWNMGSLIGDLYQATLQYPCPFMLTLGVHVLDPEATRNWAYLKAARATTNATSYMARFLPGHAGTQGGLGHRAQSHGRRPATRGPASTR